MAGPGNTTSQWQNRCLNRGRASPEAVLAPRGQAEVLASGGGGGRRGADRGPENGALASSSLWHSTPRGSGRPHLSPATNMSSPRLGTGHQVCHSWCPLPSKTETGYPCTVESGLRSHGTPAQPRSPCRTPPAASLVSAPARACLGAGWGACSGQGGPFAFTHLTLENSLKQQASSDAPSYQVHLF